MRLDMDVASSSYQCPSDMLMKIDVTHDNDVDDINFVLDSELRGNQQNKFTYENLTITADRYFDKLQRFQ